MGFALLSMLCALTFILVRALLPQLPCERTFTFSDLRRLLKSTQVRTVLLVTAVVVIGNYSAYTYIAPFLYDARAISAGLVGPFLLCYGIAGVVGNFASGAILSRSRSVRPVLAGLSVVLTAALLLIVVTQLRPLLALLMVVWGASYSALPVALQTQVCE